MSYRIFSNFHLICKVALILLLMPPAEAWGEDSSRSGANTVPGRFSELLQLIADPPAEYRPAPLWVWNADMKRPDIDRMLTELKEKGFGGAFIHPRAGLVTEYLSNDWFNLYSYSVEKGKELGLEIWIYDENSYPSGFGGGHVPAEMPESYSQGSGLALKKDSTLSPDDANFYLILKRNDDGSFTDITGNLDRHRGRKGNYYKYRKTFYSRTPWYGGYSYVDLLMPGVTEKFLEVTMRGYEKKFGKDLGKNLKGLFSDEPHIGTHGGARWTPALFDEFRKDWGYDLKEKLPMLSEETGDWRRVRHNYISTLTRLFIENWSEPMAKYCRDHNLIWTGHYWEHDWPRLSKGGDSMSMYARHQMPAIDMLFNQYNDSLVNAQFGNIRSVKELQSVASQMGQKRTLSETYGGGGWDDTFMDFKRLGDWEYALGVNYMCQHLSHTTIRGARKYDYPPVFSPVSPWWDNYRSLNDYFSRLSLLLSHGKRNADVLVIEPTTTIWTYYSYLTPMKGSKAREIGQNFQNFISEIERNHVEYDLGSELMMEDYGKVENGRIRIGEGCYKTVVLPPGTENLNSSTLRLLKEFADQGGEIIALSKPYLIDGEEEERGERGESLLNMRNVENASTLSDMLLERQCVRIISPGSRDLYHNRRSFADGELLFLANSSTEKYASGEISTRGGTVYVVDPMTGSTYKTASKSGDSSRSIKFDIPPAGSKTLFISHNGEKLISKNIETGRSTTDGTNPGRVVNPSGKMEITPERDNILILDFCDFTSHGRKSETLYYAVACDSLFARYNRKNPWDSSIQYKRNTIESDTLEKGPVSVRYNFTADDPLTGTPLTLTQEFPDIWKVRINGKELESNGKHIIDPRFGSYDISGLLRKGNNEIELYADSMSIYTEIAPLYISGNFRLESDTEGWRITKDNSPLSLGSWRAQGYPCYPWRVGYSKQYDIKKGKNRRYLVSLGEWKGTVAEVLVNGRKAGIFINPPYEVEITDLLKPGKNRIEVKVTGSNQNLYGPHYGREKGLAAPPNWKKVKTRKSGNDYDQEDYGLMEDFNLITNEI